MSVSTTPHDQVAAAIQDLITQGRWAHGIMLPRRHDLAKQLGVSLRALERAVDTLVDDGWLRAEDRRGTFVVGVPAGVKLAQIAPANPTWTVGLIARCESHPVTGELMDQFWSTESLRACERVLAADGARLRFYNVELSKTAYPDVTTALAAARADGVSALVVLNTSVQPWEAAINAFIRDWQKPLVYVPQQRVDLPCCVIHHDQRRNGGDAARHLLAAGYHGILWVGTHTETWAAERFTGAEAVVKTAVNAVFRAADQRGAKTIDQPTTALRHAALRRLLERELPMLPMPRAVVAINDSLATDLLAVMAEMGLKPGRDLGVIGFDDVGQSRVVGLSSMAAPITALGEQAARALVGAHHGLALPGVVALPSAVVPRASTYLV